jgi:hypothetical protein
MHATPSIFFTSPTYFRPIRAGPLSNTHRGFAAGPWRLRHRMPQCGKQKKLSCVYDMRHNFAPPRLSFFAQPRAQKCKDNRASSSKGGRMPHDDAETVPTYGISTSFSGETAGAEHPSGEARQPAPYFVIRRHTHCLEPRCRPYVAHHQRQRR